MSLLSVEDVTLEYRNGKQAFTAARHVSFSVERLPSLAESFVKFQTEAAAGIAPDIYTTVTWQQQALIIGHQHPIVLAGDAFFPFRDCVDEAAKIGVSAIIQPGGSVRDEDSIRACNEHNIAMIFTGMRHFRH